MALGRAFIEVHADLRPFKKDLGAGIAALLKQTQAAVNKAVREGNDQAAESVTKKARKVRVKPSLDSTDIDKDTDRVAKGLRGKISKGVRDGITDVWSSPGKTFDQITLLIIAAAVAAAPVVIPMIGGILQAGIASAGIGAGIALAFRDLRIKAAAKDLGSYVLDGLTRAASVFVFPLLKSFGILRGAADDFIGNMERGFQSIAPYVDDLANGLASSIRIIGTSLEVALGNSGPILRIIAEYMPVIADAFGYFLEQVSSSGGLRSGLVLFFQMLGDAIILTTDVLTFFGDLFAAIIMFIDQLPPALVPDSWEQDIDEMVAAWNDSEQPGENFKLRILGIGGAFAGADQKAKDLTTSLNTFFGAALGWTDAAINFEESIDNVAAAFKRNGDSIDIGTEKGRENVRAVQASINAAIAARDAKIKETGSVEAGNRVYATHIERLRGVLKNAGLTKTEIENLIGAYDEVPPDVQTDVSAPGLSAALAQAIALNAELDRLRHKAQSNPLGKGGDYAGVGGYAEGGIVTRPELAWVGEGGGPEAIIPLSNPGRAAEIMSEAGLLGLGGGTIVVQMVLDGKVIDERVVRANAATARRISQQPRALI